MKLLLAILVFFCIISYFYYKKYGTKEAFFQDIYLTDSDNPLEQNPEFLLPSNNTATIPDSDGTTEGKDLYENSKIHAYIGSDGKISFKRGEIEKIYSKQLSNFPKLVVEEEETDEAYLSRFMVPLLWQTTKNQFASFNTLSNTIKTIEDGLREANINMVEINKEVDKLGESSIKKQREEEFDFKKF